MVLPELIAPGACYYSKLAILKLFRVVSGRSAIGNALRLKPAAILSLAIFLLSFILIAKVYLTLTSKNVTNFLR